VVSHDNAIEAEGETVMDWLSLIVGFGGGLASSMIAWKIQHRQSREDQRADRIYQDQMSTLANIEDKIIESFSLCADIAVLYVIQPIEEHVAMFDYSTTMKITLLNVQLESLARRTGDARLVSDIQAYTKSIVMSKQAKNVREAEDEIKKMDDAKNVAENRVYALKREIGRQNP
jgi:hypothetical protein